MTLPTPTKTAAETTAYTPRPRQPGVDLYLDANEGARRASLMLEPERAAELARSYPELGPLTEAIAARIGRTVDEVVVTNGADDAIDRVMRAYLEPGRTLAVATPTFGMIPNYARIQGADVLELPWRQGWPIDALREAAGADVGVIAMVSPNNPTGKVIDPATVIRVAGEFPGAAILLDLAYVEYAEPRIVAETASLPNVIQTRTLSKAWGLAGLRVGYAAAAPEVADRLRAVGSPYPVSAWSAAVATDRLRGGEASVQAHVATVRRERDELYELLASLGARPLRSCANFVFAEFDDAARVQSGLRSVGVAVRGFDGRMQNALRIGCPGDALAFTRLARALRSVMDPDAYIFDLDGVIADVTNSYREAIRRTAASWDVELSPQEIADGKRRGDANDDWRLTRRLLADRGVDLPLDDVTKRFEDLYQSGLWREEGLLVCRARLEALAACRPIAIVTGRPRRDTRRFLETYDLAELFSVVVTRDDVTSLKPSPEGIRQALDRLGVETAWYLGDTVDDIRAAAASGIVPVGVLAPGAGEEDRRALHNAGAMTVVTNLDEVL